jgi:hypothetical protein
MLNDLTPGAEGFEEALNEIYENLKKDRDITEEIQEIYEDLLTAPVGDTNGLKILNAAIEEYDIKTSQVKSLTDSDATNRRNASRRKELSAERETQTEVEGQKTARKLFEDSQQIKDQTQNILHLVDGISSLVFVLQSLHSLNDIIDDKTLTNTEKFDKIITNLVSSAPMLIMGLKDMKEGFGAFTSIAQDFGKTDFAKGLFTKLGNHFEIFTEASIAAQSEALGLGASLGALAVPIAAAIAGIVALVLIIKTIHDEIHKFDIALDKANENLKIASDNTEKAKSKLTELKSGLDSVKNAEDSFEGLKQGTTE